MHEALQASFNIGLEMLVPVAVVVLMAARRLPAIASILTGVLAGMLVAIVFQQPAVAALGHGMSADTALVPLKVIWIVLFDGYSATIVVDPFIEGVFTILIAFYGLVLSLGEDDGCGVVDDGNGLRGTARVVAVIGERPSTCDDEWITDTSGAAIVGFGDYAEDITVGAIVRCQ